MIISTPSPQSFQISSTYTPSPQYRVPTTRSLHRDKEHVLFAYEAHTKDDPYCEDPFGSARLCFSGLILARAVVKYLYRRSRAYFSSYGHEGGETSRAYLPESARSVRKLLMAVEQGFLGELSAETNSGATRPDFSLV